MKKDTVVIVGTHVVTRGLAPFGDKEKDFWLFNEAATQDFAKKVDAVFQMHSPEIFLNKANRNDKGHAKWMQEKHPFPIYMQEAYPECPAAVKYPLHEVTADVFGSIKKKRLDGTMETVQYFSSSVAYAVALAIYLGYKTIEIYGVEMQTDTEYHFQRDGLLLVVGIAMGRGINVIMPKATVLMRGLLYGYEGDIVIHRQVFESKHQALEIEEANAEARMNQNGGMVQAAMESLFEAKSKQEQDKFANLFLMRQKDWMASCIEFGVYSGAAQENAVYMKQIDAKIQAIGGAQAVESLSLNENETPLQSLNGFEALTTPLKTEA